MSSATAEEQTFTPEQLDRATRRLVQLSKLATETDDHGEPTHEALRAQEQLQELTAKYRISEATLAARKIEEGTYVVGQTEVELSDGYPDFQVNLFTTLADAYGLTVVYRTEKRGSGRRPRVTLYIYGSETTADLVTNLYSQILTEVFNGMFKYLAWRRSVAVGFRLTRSQTKHIQIGYALGFGGVYAQRVREIMGDSSSSLVLLEEAISKEVELRHPDVKITRVRADSGAVEAGQNNAKEAPLMVQNLGR